MDLVCDLDGTVWLAGEPIGGVAEAVAKARAAGHRFLFATNNSGARVSEVEAGLARIGIDAAGCAVTSSMATAGLVQPGERVFLIGGPGLSEELVRRGAMLVEPGPDQRGRDLRVDAVVVGRDTAFDFRKLSLACDAIRTGARYLASNTDPTFPTPAGIEPGGGAIVAAVTTAAGVGPQVAGKPHRPMAEAIRAALNGDTSRVVVVGDVTATDGLLAEQLGVPFALVLSGATPVAPEGADRPTYVAADLTELIQREFS